MIKPSITVRFTTYALSQRSRQFMYHCTPLPRTPYHKDQGKSIVTSTDMMINLIMMLEKNQHQCQRVRISKGFKSHLIKQNNIQQYPNYKHNVQVQGITLKVH